MARFLIDDCLPPRLAEALRALGHDASHAREVGLSGADDTLIHARAMELGAILVTRDLDFSDQRAFTAGVGLVVVRFRGRVTSDQLIEQIVRQIRQLAAEIEALEDAIMTLEPGRSRIRRRS